jgi:hypothetical protein
LNQLLGLVIGLSGFATRPALASIRMDRRKKSSPSPAAEAEALRVQRLREDARRSLSTNLSEGIALSHKLLRFTGAALKN